MLTLRKTRRPARLRERRHGAAAGRDERHLLGLARLDHGGAQPAPVLGPVFLGRRRAASRRVRSDPGHVQLRELPGLGVDRAGAGDGDLALPRLQRALEDDLRRPGDAQGRHVHRRHQPMAGHDLPRHRPVGRALTATSWSIRSAARSAPSRTRRRHLDRRPVAHADLQAAQRRAHRADLSAALPVSQGSADSGGAGPLSRRPLGGILLHPPQHRHDHPGHAVVGQRHSDVDRHDGRLSRRPPTSTASCAAATSWRGSTPRRMVEDIARDRRRGDDAAAATGEFRAARRTTSTPCSGPPQAASAIRWSAIPVPSSRIGKTRR